MEYDHDILLRNIKCENSIVYWWFTIIGSVADASRYRVKVTVYMKSDSVREYVIFNLLYTIIT